MVNVVNYTLPTARTETCFAPAGLRHPHWRRPASSSPVPTLFSSLYAGRAGLGTTPPAQLERGR